MNAICTPARIQLTATTEVIPLPTRGDILIKTEAVELINYFRQQGCFVKPCILELMGATIHGKPELNNGWWIRIPRDSTRKLMRYLLYDWPNRDVWEEAITQGLAVLK